MSRKSDKVTRRFCLNSKESLSSQNPGIVSVLFSIQKALLSLTQPGIFLRVLVPFLFSLFIGLFCLIFFWTDFTHWILNSINSIEWFAQSFTWIFSLFGSDGSSFMIFMAGFLFFLNVLIAIYVITVILTSIILVPLLVPVLRNRYHPELPLHTESNLKSSIKNSIKATVLFLILILLCSPLFLIPGVPIFISLILNAYLSQKIFPFDVLQDLASAEEIKAFQKEHRIRLWILAISTGLLIYIPLVNFLAPSIMALSFIFYILDNLGHFRARRSKDQKI
ncbi:MAG: EI24 domain-containing protein [Bdellovibrionota bacterium]